MDEMINDFFSVGPFTVDFRVDGDRDDLRPTVALRGEWDRDAKRDIPSALREAILLAIEQWVEDAGPDWAVKQAMKKIELEDEDQGGCAEGHQMRENGEL